MPLIKNYTMRMRIDMMSEKNFKNMPLKRPNNITKILLFIIIRSIHF